MRAESEAEDILVRTVLVRAPWRVADEGPIEGHQLVGLYRKMRERTDTWTGWSSGELAAIARDLGCGGFRRPDRMIQILREAGLYTPGPDPTLEHETWFEAPIWAFRDEVARTIVAVEVEIERLQGRVNRLRTWPDQVLCVGSSRDSFDFVPSPSTVSKCERPAFGAPEEEPDGAPCDAAPVLVPLAFCPYRSRESLACTEPAP